ncbi:LysR family transcriptional regulator [Faunimonas sp. B44]|uniref:LysR family transcriptional regulator n=1 Tax=Faunimonas sp. B44 TaxID=3461493 RepID=UPI004043A1E8
MRRLDNIDLRLLRVFVTLADAGGFADAQIALNLSQSTLSTHLSALEKKIGAPLCERGRRGFRLTEFGESVYAAARQLFTDIESFEARLGRDRGKLTGRLRIGIVDGVVTSPELGLQAALGRFCRYAPDVFLDLALGTPRELERAVTEGTRDVVIGPMSQKAPQITYRAFCREPHALYCGAGHPLFETPDAAIAREDVEKCAFSVRGYLHFDDLYRANHPRPAGTVMHMEAQVMMILSGQYIGFLPCHIGEDWAGRRQMRALKRDIYGFASQHFTAVRTSEARRPLLLTFLRELRRNTERTGRDAGEAAIGTALA